LANNKLGELVPPAGWKSVAKYSDGSGTKYIHNDGREQDDPPAGSKPEGIIAIANAIPDMGALSKLIFGGDYDSNKGTRPEPATLEVGMTEANFSNKNLGAGGAFIISAWITHKDKGAMTKFDISSNYIRAEGGKALAAGLKGNQVIKELNISGNKLGHNSNGGADTSGVIAIADVIPGMRALLVLSMKSNHIGVDGGKALAEGLKGNNVITELNIADNNLTYYGEDMSGIIILANVIKDMRAMTSLNLASNELGTEGAEIVAEAIKVTMCTPAIILVPFSCPSDFSINCCCLLLSTGYGGTIRVVVKEEWLGHQRCRAGAW
jgi:hypothetical protein